MGHVFISYSKKNKTYARALADKLLSEGFDVWIDDRIDYGENWSRTIFEAIDASDAFLVIMTPQSAESQWVERECHYADKRKKPIYPLLLDGEEFPMFITTQYVDVSDGNLPPAEFYDELARVVERKTERGTYVAETLPTLKLDKPATRQQAASAQIAPPAVPDAPRRRSWRREERSFPTYVVMLVTLALAGSVVLALNLLDGGDSEPEATQTTETIMPEAATGVPGEQAFASAEVAFNADQYEQALADYAQAAEQGYLPQAEAGRIETLLTLSLFNNNGDGDEIGYCYIMVYCDEALPAYEALLPQIQDNSMYASLFFAAGNAYLMRGEYDKALQSYNTLINSGVEKDYPAVYLALGDTYYSMDSVHGAEALAAYERYLALVPEYTDPELQDRLAVLRGEVAATAPESTPEMVSSDASATGDLAPLFEAAWNAYNNEDYALARARFEEILSIDSTNSYALMGLGNVAEAEDDVDTALAYFNQALTADTQFAPAYLYRGYLLWDNEEYLEAIADFNAALEFGYSPAWEVHLAIGDAYLDYSESDEGDICEDMADCEAAQDAFGKALEAMQQMPAEQINDVVRNATEYVQKTLEELNAILANTGVLNLDVPTPTVDNLGG
ncbi:MAG: hypothetical protein OHK0046_22020 [Anaerolineae bacterium]